MTCDVTGVGGGRTETETERKVGENWQQTRLCNVLSFALGRARHPQMSAYFIQTFHFSPAAIATETKPPRQLCYCWSSAKGCSMLRWSEVDGMVNKDKAPAWHEHRLVREESALSLERNPPTFGADHCLYPTF